MQHIVLELIIKIKYFIVWRHQVQLVFMPKVYHTVEGGAI